MSFSSSINSLSALTPIEFVYSFNTEEALSFYRREFSNKLGYNSYTAFENIQDLAISKKNALFLTDVKSLSSIFKQSTNTLDIKKLAGTVFLKTADDQYIIQNGETFFVGSSAIYDRATISIVPVDANGTVELYSKDGIPLVVDATYPYTVRAFNETLTPDKYYTKLFKIDYSDNIISFKTTTIEGDRYLSYGTDGVFRAVGLMLNDCVFNSYLFTPEFITTSELSIGFDPSSIEVKYYNDIETFQNRLRLDIKEKNISDTNLLISCATSDITKEDKTPINIALLRTNFTSTGTYAPKH